MEANRLPQHISEEDIEDIVVTIFEGGYNYWGTHDGEQVPYRPGFEPLSVMIAEGVLSGNSYTILDKEDGDEVGEFNLENLLKGVKMWEEFMHKTFDTNEGIDAEDADMIMQFGVLGELVYG